MKFEIDEEQKEKMNKWQSALLKDGANTGAIGGRFTYTFTPTSIGVVVKVIDGVTEKELDLTDYDMW